MPSVIQLKTGTGSAIPSALAQGEVAINIDNGLWYYGSGSGENVKRLESFTHVTASGNVSASGIITTTLQGTGTTTGFETSGYLSSSALYVGDVSTFVSASLGNVSASGTIIGSNLSGTNTGDQNLTNLAVTGSDVIFNHITASGAISASGNLHIGGNISGSSISSSTDITAGGIILIGKGDHSNIASTDLLSVGQSNAGARIKLFSDHVTGNRQVAMEFSASGGDIGYVIGLDRTTDTFAINPGTSTASPVFAINNVGDITASGNISASGNLHMEGNISGSSISSSNATFIGTVTAEQLTSTDDATIENDLVVGGSIMHGADIDTKISFNTDNIDLTTNNTIKCRIASALTTFANAPVTIDKYLFTNHVTASGNISSSGNFIGNRQFNATGVDDNAQQTGDIIYIGGGSTTAGDIVYMKTDGEWGSAQADATSTSTSLLGIALGDDPDADGVLLRGMYTLDHDVGDNQGVPLYLSDTTAGQATTTAPSDSGDVVRIIGYNLGDDDQIWFDPDKTWVELS